MSARRRLVCRAPGAGAPLARVDGREASLDEALRAAAAILRGARAPLVCGLALATCEAQRAAVAIADALGAAIDPAGGSPALLAYQDIGASTATLGEIRDRAEVVVVWRADPATTHPRLLERLEVDRPGRPLVVVDEQPTATAALADAFVALAPDRAVEALWPVRALVRDVAASAEGLPLDALAEVARLLRGAHGAVLHAATGTSRRSGSSRSCAS